jgi:hypothetical protein
VRNQVIFCRVSLWYRPYYLDPKIPFETIAWVREQGGTNLNKAGDEARKQTVTDGLSRCFMALGLGAGIYAGFGDNKYGGDSTKTSAKSPSAPESAQENNAPIDETPSVTQPPKTPSRKSGSRQAQKPPVAEFQGEEMSVNQFISELISTNPLLASCEVRRKGESLFFAYQKGTGDDSVFIADGFVAPVKHPNLLCKRFEIPLPPTSGENQIQ